jgi:cag pathogenicity island protein 24
MKYRRLTKEQLEEMHQEFINFLATQSITAKEWNEIKTNQPEIAEQEIDVFSDLVWEGVLTKAKFLEHISPRTMNLFSLGENEMELISIMVGDELIDITTKEGYQWLQKNLLDDEVKIFTAKKAYSDDPNADKFKLIETGAIITKGQLFNYFDDLMELGKETNGF